MTVRRPPRLEAEIQVPGDKSISHRALILNAVADGDATLTGLSPGADVASTAACLGRLAVGIDGDRVSGVGLGGLRPASEPLDCGNSGTTMRLLGGLLAAQPFESTLVGDESLSSRPMERVTMPLREMGANATWPPLKVGGRLGLHGIQHRPTAPSAQVKSALLLAGLYASGMTEVAEPAPTRNHTELMLAAMGASCETSGGWVRLAPTKRLRPLDLHVPGDLSAAAFWLVAAALHPAARVSLRSVGTNPTRGGLLEVLASAGMAVGVRRPRREGAEPVADLEAGTVAGSKPGLRLAGDAPAAVIDELPVLAVAATMLEGESVIRDAGELRVKESDRISAMARGLGALGASIEELPDGWRITGPTRLEGARVDSGGDHRVAMALAVAGLLADGQTEIEDAGCVRISYPTFWAELDRLGAIC